MTTNVVNLNKLREGTPEYGLYRRIQAYSLDERGAAVPLTLRLAHEQRWSLPYVRRVVAEYKRFAFLAVVCENAVTPSDAVDQVWHLHMIYSRQYWQRFCGEVLGQPLHHEPSRGGPAEQARYRNCYENTLSSYEAWFGGRPPNDIWPASAQRFDDHARWVRIDASRHWFLPKLPWFPFGTTS